MRNEYGSSEHLRTTSTLHVDNRLATQDLKRSRQANKEDQQ